MILFFIVIYVGARVLLELVAYLDGRAAENTVAYLALCALAMSVALWLATPSPVGNLPSLTPVALLRALTLGSFPTGLLLGIASSVLLAAAVTDRRTTQVYRFFWWIGDAAVLLLMLLRGTEAYLPGVCFFILVQYLVFARLYGRADCHAFSLCALIGAALGLGFTEDVLHMVFAVFFLFAVQLKRRNIAPDGNLKYPVAFIPYIAVSFCFSLLIFRGNGAILSAIKYITPTK